MTNTLLVASIVMFLCLVINRISVKVGIPTLVLFILLGMLFGSEGLVGIKFDDYSVAQEISTIALIFIVFYGGFGTNFKTAKVVLMESVLLSTVGVVGSSIITAVLCHFILKFPFWESMLLGAVIGSTDAASVFSILRTKKLGIKEGTAPVLEIESGSNDPFAYMFMLVCIMILSKTASATDITKMFFLQLIVGIISGILISKAAIYISTKHRFETEGFDQIFFVAVAIFSYAFPTYFGGNGFLSSYIVGIILGNNKIRNKSSLIHFFDGITGLMQLMVFFLLGLLSFPSKIWQVKFDFLFVFLALTFVARPIMVFMLYLFNKSSTNKRLLLSFCGLRGAASIVFATMVLESKANLSFDIFHIVFGVVLLSITFQGTLIPYITKILNMVDKDTDVMETFSDYIDDVPVDYIEIKVVDNHPWIGKNLEELALPHDLLIVSIQRDNSFIMPRGQTVLKSGDSVVMTAIRFNKNVAFNITEKTLKKGDSYIGKTIEDISSDNVLVTLVIRGSTPIIPKGNTLLLENDVCVFSKL